MAFKCEPLVYQRYLKDLILDLSREDGYSTEAKLPYYTPPQYYQFADEVSPGRHLENCMFSIDSKMGVLASELFIAKNENLHSKAIEKFTIELMENIHIGSKYAEPERYPASQFDSFMDDPAPKVYGSLFKEDLESLKDRVKKMIYHKLEGIKSNNPTYSASITPAFSSFKARTDELTSKLNKLNLAESSSESEIIENKYEQYLEGLATSIRGEQVNRLTFYTDFIEKQLNTLLKSETDGINFKARGNIEENIINHFKLRDRLDVAQLSVIKSTVQDLIETRHSMNHTAPAKKLKM